MITVKELEKYTKEITRKHVKNFGFRMFKHPTYSSLIMVKNDQVVGMTNFKILHDNSYTRNLLNQQKFLPFEF